MTTIETIALSVGGFIAVSGFAVIGFFVRLVQMDVRTNTGNIGKLKGKTELIEQDANAKVDKLTEVTNIQIQSLTGDIRELTKAISHMNGNFKMASQGQAEMHREWVEASRKQSETNAAIILAIQNLKK